ncbi:ATP-binding cassette domain-containing protein [Microbacterium sp. W1N]|uniref:metal ABC transporter ATP-binding protein n=1 Tax=Microbacterium festucae TaxID=2977531 RepID=UPI0021C1C8D3|nr:ATP-binding cassette domain-containing protein [Microbacterium festucae]MCT9820688.1 ATP-binding cassette domain-containing protein [Microbacterium festucae]
MSPSHPLDAPLPRAALPGAALPGTARSGAALPGAPVIARLRQVGVDIDGHAALRGVDLDARAGRVLAVVGANGSGKSTALSVMAGLTAPTAGSAWRAPGTAVALVPQHTTTGERLPLNVEGVVAMGRWRQRGFWRPLRRVDREAIASAIAAVGLTALARRRIGELSGGQRRRAFLAQALAQQATLVLLDEPMTGLDDAARADAAAAISALTAAGAAVVVVTHDLAELGRVDAVATLADGRLGAISGPPDCTPAPPRASVAW